MYDSLKTILLLAYIKKGLEESHMSVTLDGKTENLKSKTDFPNDIKKLSKTRDSLYEKIDFLTERISEYTNDLAEFYKKSIGESSVLYIEENDNIYQKAKRVDNLVNEFNDTRILIELIEKKIEKHNK